MARHAELVNVKGTDLSISRLSLGAAPIGGLYTSVSEATSDSVMAAVFAAGINYIDTAPLYGYGVSEVRVGRGLRAAGKPYVLSTKVGRVLNPGKNLERDKFPDSDPNTEVVFDFSADGIRRSLDDSLNRLGVDKIDIAYIHDPDDHLSEAINTAYPVLDDLRAQGVISAIGVGMNHCTTAMIMMREADLNIALIAGRFTLLDQEAQNELYPLALKRNVSIVAAGVYNSGVLANPNPGAYYDYLPATGEIIDRARKIGAVLKEFNVSLTAAALQFPLRHPAVATVLTGSRTQEELEANIADFDTELPDGIWGELEAAGLIEPLKIS